MVNAMNIIILIFACVSRPYRETGTNIILIILSVTFVVIGFEMQMKINGYNTDLFSDKYFFWMQLLQSAFFWFVIFVFNMSLLLMGDKWNVTKEYI